MKLTLRQMLEEVSRFAGDSGNDPDSKESLRLLNRARLLMYPMDDWEGTIRFICVPCLDNCFFPPHDIESIRAIWDGNGNVDVWNDTHMQIDHNNIRNYCDRVARAASKTGISQVLPVCLPEEPWIPSLLATNGEDEGTEITITGRSSFGNKISSTVKLKECNEEVELTEEFKTIESIAKPQTCGPVTIYNSDKKIYTLDACEENPCYHQYRMQGRTCGCYVVLKGKRKFRNYTTKDLDRYVDLTSVDGIEFAMLALNSKDKKGGEGLAEYAGYLAAAKAHFEVVKEDLNSSARGYEIADSGHSYATINDPYRRI